MIDELEALIGHVFVVGGRAISTPPPGALVQLPPRKAQRGREQDTFFTLVTPAGTNQGSSALYESLAHLAADLYFRSGGGVTSGLREAITGVNTHLLDQADRYEANMACLVMRGHEIYAARVGACVCLLRQGDFLLTFPPDLQDEYAVNALPLGYSQSLDIKLTHYDVTVGHVMVIADSAFAQGSAEVIFGAMGADSVQAVIEAVGEPLKSFGTTKAQATIIQFVTTDTPDPVIATPLPGVRRSSAMPVTPASAQAPTSAAQPAPTKTAKQPAPKPPSPKQSAPRPGFGRAKPAPEPAPEAESVEPAEVEEFAPESETSAAKVPDGKRRTVVNSVLDRLLPEPDENGPQISARVAAALAILVPLVVVFIVVGLQLSQFDRSAFDKSVADVQAAADQANGMLNGNPDQAKAAWLGVLQRVNEVEASSGRSDDPTLEQIRAQAQRILDGFDKVTRVPVVALRSFSDTAKLARPIVRGDGTEMYTLDLSQSAIYRDSINPVGNILLTRSPAPIVQRGTGVSDGRTVQQLIDVIWMSEGGVPRGGNVLAALDSQGILVTYSPTFAPATSQTLPGAVQWVKPVAMSTWEGRLYILDLGTPQIWRYLPKDSLYPDSPEEYFDTSPNLKNAVDMGIDSSGNVYILFSNGTIQKFYSGSSRDFSFKGMPEGALKSGSSMFVDSNSVLPAIYIADPVDQSIYMVTMEGRFQRRYRADDPNAFKNLTGVYVDQGRIYAASGSAVYVFNAVDSGNPGSSTTIPPTTAP